MVRVDTTKPRLEAMLDVSGVEPFDIPASMGLSPLGAPITEARRSNFGLLVPSAFIRFGCRTRQINACVKMRIMLLCIASEDIFARITKIMTSYMHQSFETGKCTQHFLQLSYSEMSPKFRTRKIA
jgi:hypothetical protein